MIKEDILGHNQNNDVQVFIIKQIERQYKGNFENKYKNFLGKNKFSQQNFLKDTKTFFNNFNLEKDRKFSYLIPLIYDKSSFDNNTSFSQLIINNNEKQDLKTFINKDYKDIGNSIYINEKYNSILNCPLLDYTKLSYVFQVNKIDFLGISDVTSFNVSLNVHQPSSCSLSLNNFNFKYNFTYEDELENDEDIYKSVFDTNDIVILRIAKRENKDYTKSKFIDPYAKDENDYYKTIFTGFINNVNESINWQSKNQTLNINCSGPSKIISYKRLVTGQAVCDKDVSSAIIPTSCYSVPQALDKNNKITIKNKEVIKNIIVRAITSIDSIEECWDNKTKFTMLFLKNAEQGQSNNELIKGVNEARTKYNVSISNNFDKFCNSEENAEKTGKIDIYTNIFKVNRDYFLPSFTIRGTDQPAFQYSFNTFNNIFVATYETIYQFIKKIAENLEFVFYDDQYGVIHFELIDTDMFHLYDSNDPNNLTQVISFNKNQNTDAITNIMTITTNGEYAGVLDGQSLGILAVVRDPISIQKYGERPMPPKPITGLTRKKACEVYGKGLMYKMNRKINSYSLSLIGDPSVKLGKYAYFKDFHKLFYVESISHQYSAGNSLISSINGSYERQIIGRANELIDNPFNNFNFIEPLNKKNKNSLFISFRNQMNNLLSNIEANNYTKQIEKIWEKFYSGDQQPIKKFHSNIINKLAPNYGYLNEAEKQYINNDLYYVGQLPFLYFDGYIWTENFERDLYTQAKLIQNEIIKQEQEDQKKKNKKNTKNISIQQNNNNQNNVKSSTLEKTLNITKTINDFVGGFLTPKPLRPFVKWGQKKVTNIAESIGEYVGTKVGGIQNERR